MATGTIKTKTDKGFGFIQMADGSPDVFFHNSECNGLFESESLKVGATVNFELAMGDKGPKATNVVAGGSVSPAAKSEEGAVEETNDIAA